MGGRLGEGEKLYELISSRGLDTYVSSQCMSACTMAFAGGRERYLREGAALGFHKGAFPGANDGRLDQLQKAIFVRAGFDAGFITKALSTPSSEMYQPESSELLSAHVITAVTDGTRFALSGMGPNISKDVFAASLAKAQPLFGTMKERFPDFYENFIDDYYQNLMQGKSEAETIATTREKLQSFLIPLLPLADDAVLVDEEGGGIGGFVGRIPAQAVLIGELVVGVDDEMKVRGKRTFFCHELLGPFLKIGRGAGVDEEKLNALCGEFVRVDLEVVNLALAIGALITGIAA